MKKIAALFALSLALSSLGGCGVIHDLYQDKGVADYSTNVVFRMSVAWYEKPDHAYSPAFYNYDAKIHNWGPEAIQYRWILLKSFFKDKTESGGVFRTGRIPDGLPVLKVGDIVDVYLPDDDLTNYNQLKGPVILRLVCRENDRPCKKAAKVELGGRSFGMVSKGMPDMSNLTFSKRFDATGHILPQ